MVSASRASSSRTWRRAAAAAGAAPPIANQAGGAVNVGQRNLAQAGYGFFNNGGARTHRGAGAAGRGDRLYGADPVLAARLGLTRQWLHAVRLSFAHPADGHPVSFTSPYPPDLAHALDILRAES